LIGKSGVARQNTILYFANCNNYHTIKWCSYFSSVGYDVHVASLEKPLAGNSGTIDRVSVHWLSNDSERLGSDIQKLSYFRTISQAKALIKEVNPDIVHAHYASSYGTICSFACKRPYYLSVWGSDVYEFPQKSFLHKAILKRSLDKATWIMSTSRAMAVETHKYTSKEIAITPFGVDMSLFNPDKAVPHEGFVVGTVKGLESKYGIETLLHACSLVHRNRPDINLKVRIAGAGTQEKYLRDTASSLGMDGYCKWLGFITQENAACEWASFDVALVPSESESFGVSAVEAQASGTALVISDIPGLMEACDDGKTAIVVRRGDDEALANAVEQLADDPERRTELSCLGRAYVTQAYEYTSCFRRIQDIYDSNESVRAY
jgi:glycosyltransferase involved in cell wall biosynthesis